MKVIKMHPSHLPVLKAVVKLLHPKSCIECGSGEFSTPLLSKIDTFETIEHSEEWAEAARKKYGSGHVLHIPLGNLKYNVYPKDVSKKTRKRIAELYRCVAEKCDLLFVDSYAAVRDIVLALFWGKFNVAVLHDTQKSGYGYQRVIEKLAKGGIVQIQCKPINGEPWTDIIISVPDLNNLKEVINAITDEIKKDKYRFNFTVKAWL